MCSTGSSTGTLTCRLRRAGPPDAAASSGAPGTVSATNEPKHVPIKSAKPTDSRLGNGSGSASPPRTPLAPSNRLGGDAKSTPTRSMTAVSPTTQKRKVLTNRHVAYAVAMYFFLPLSLLLVSSRLHDFIQENIETSSKLSQPTMLSIGEFLRASFRWITSALLTAPPLPTTSKSNFTFAMERVLASKVLLLGFATSQEMWHNVLESILTATCWGTTFLLVRKGLNPETPRNFVRNGWRGASLSCLSVFHSNLAQRILRHRPTLRRVVCRILGSILPRCCSGWYCGAIYNAILVGLCWGTCNTLIRRRLDPAMRDDLLRRHWKDVLFGALALSISSLFKSALKHMLPKGAVEAVLAQKLGTVLHGTSAFSAGLHLLGLGTELDFWHHTFEGVKAGSSWGLTYLFIRRGLNPESRKSAYIRKYWRDAFYGGAALFCYIFLRLAAKKWLPIILSHSAAFLTHAVILSRDEL